MVTHPVLHSEFVSRTDRRWSPRLGYALAVLGSGLAWSAIVVVTVALT